MHVGQNEAMDRVRLAEVVAAISMFTDLGTGQPQEHALNTCIAALRIADRLGLEPAQREALYYASLLRFLGCTADSWEDALLFEASEIDLYAAAATVMGSPGEELKKMVGIVGAGRSLPTRLRLLARVLGDPGGKVRSLSAHCEVAARLATRMGLPDGVVAALAAAYARWDGHGAPAKLAGEDIPVAMRVAIVARDVELLSRHLGATGTVDALRKRRGKAYDPTVVDAALDAGVESLSIDTGDPWSLVLDAEPEPVRTVGLKALDDILVACADFTDLKFPHLAGHSRTVAATAGRAAQLCGLDADAAEVVRRAGLVHDVGRVSVPARVWMKAGPLTSTDWEAVRLHAYTTERILARCPALQPLARLAGAHHERLDGTGYHRGSRTLEPAARILGAADAFCAMTEPRPHRPPLSGDEAAAELRAGVADGRFGRAEADAVLAAAGQASGSPRVAFPAGLTEREVDVLRQLAAGLTNKEIACRLYISPKTVGHHLENVYAKAGVTSRAAAVVFAMEHDLLAK
jgi:HD-GYP domain-containing protein (c-di-GMP phosphodiesterase class II)/DNA-binding CsgD family transcriptional regulator